MEAQLITTTLTVISEIAEVDEIRIIFQAKNSEGKTYTIRLRKDIVLWSLIKTGTVLEVQGMVNENTIRPIKHKIIKVPCDDL